ncbi:hypothetical protein O3W44_00810 [Pantoea sp. LMR881]|uniref:hypothetical protein n=1 Tax=Pantoea sp. LMR881 TaxID=3014336 RepID=UPI0022B06814|nr:hypothetical protein [Pantoea sp. LMR881]MCZ4057928.1 hypothetical protein [Pantoea sp. LMR881]
MKKTLYKITIISLMLFLLSCKTQDEVTSINEKYAQSIFESAQNAWPQLNKAWENNLYQQLRLIVADKENAWAIDDSSIVKIPYEEITKRNLPVEYFHYQQIEWSDKRPTLYMSLGRLCLQRKKRGFRRVAYPKFSMVLSMKPFIFLFMKNGSYPQQRIILEQRSIPPRLHHDSIETVLFGPYLLPFKVTVMVSVTHDIGLNGGKKSTQMRQAASTQPMLLKGVRSISKRFRKFARKAYILIRNNTTTHSEKN